MIKAPSPNFNERAAEAPLQFIVLHYTDMESAQEALAHMCNVHSQVSAHYMIDEQGEIYALVDEEKRAWHAGKSSWHGLQDMNSRSIGIEIVNKGHSCGYTPFPDAQIESLKILLRDLFEKYHLRSDCLLGHSDIAPTRKKDPGELFPWEDLAREGFGFWPKPSEEDGREMAAKEAAELLKKIGYNLENEEDFNSVLIAFQRHYAVDQLDKGLTTGTAAKLRALAKLITE